MGKAAVSKVAASSKATGFTVGVYVRVSTSGQNEAGQVAEIDRWLAGHGIEGAARFIDRASGDNLQRPGFEALQQAVFVGEIKTVIVYKLDRLSRSLADGVATLTDWLGKGVRLVSVSQGMDFSGTIGKMFASLLFGIAEMEQENRRERQAAGIAVAKAKGGVYRGRRKGATKKQPDQARKLRDQGYKIREIQEMLGISANTVYLYLRATKAKAA